MKNTDTLIRNMYAAFNRRDIDATLAHMTESVDWPTASEGGHVVGKEQIRAYWTRQWAEFDPHVDPTEIIDRPNGTTGVRVHQLVKNLHGDVLLDEEVWHVYTLNNGLIERMDIQHSNPAAQSAGWSS
jgi:hypothetical protein